MKRPIALIMGAVLLVVRVATVVVYIVLASINPKEFTGSLILQLEGDAPSTASDDELASVALTVLLTTYGVALAVLLALAVFVFFGFNGARIIAMSGSSLSILVAFIDYWINGAEITLRTTLPTLASDILVLLALSSQSARDYARRPKSRVTPAARRRKVTIR